MSVSFDCLLDDDVPKINFIHVLSTFGAFIVWIDY